MVELVKRAVSNMAYMIKCGRKNVTLAVLITTLLVGMGLSTVPTSVAISAKLLVRLVVEIK